MAETDDFLIGLDCKEKFLLIQSVKLKDNTKDIHHKNTKNKFWRQCPNENTDSTIDKYKLNLNEHLPEDNFNISINHLDTENHSGIKKLTCKYKSLFAKDKYDIGTVKGYEAHIDLLIDKYCSKRPYRYTIEDNLIE